MGNDKLNVMAADHTGPYTLDGSEPTNWTEDYHTNRGASYRVYIVNVLEQIDSVMTEPRCPSNQNK